jgi:hypothetical protein
MMRAMVAAGQMGRRRAAGGGAGPLTNAATGSFLTGTGAAASTVAVAGLGFQPKLVLFYWNGSATSGDEITTGNLRCGGGYAASTSDRRNVGGQSEHGPTTMNTDHQAGDESCIRVLSTAGALAGALDLQSMDAGGFTLVVDTQMAADMRVHYMAFGGDDITNVQGGEFLEPAATGNQATTGVGFQPDIIFTFGVPMTGTPPNQGAFNIGYFGAAISSSAMGVIAWGDENNIGTSDTGCVNDKDHCVARIDAAVGSQVARAALVSMDVDGFTLNWVSRAFTGVHYFYVAVKGGSWAIGQFDTATDTSTVRTVSGLSFEPKGLLFYSTGSADVSDASLSSDGAIVSVGLATSASTRQMVGWHSLHAQATAVVMEIRETDSIYAMVVHNNPTPTLRATMDLTAITSDGFTAQMTAAETAVVPITYVVFG